MASLPSIQFTHNLETGVIQCRIETKRLILESIDLEKHLPAYNRIFQNKANFAHYASQEPWDLAKIKNRVEVWARRWKEGNPFSALVISQKVDGMVVAHLVLGSGSAPGISEMAAMIDMPFQGKRFASEAGQAIRAKLLPFLTRNSVGGARFQAIEATARPENLASCRVLERAGFILEKTENMYGNERRFYRYRVVKEPISAVQKGVMFITLCAIASIVYKKAFHR